MAPPEAPDTGAGNTPPAVSVCLEGLKKRPDFLACTRGDKVARTGFVLQGRNREDGERLIRFGVTASKKVGNAVVRNRAKRRLRALAQEVLPEAGRPGWDYVLVARAGATADLPFDTLRSGLSTALGQLHQR